MKFNPYEYIAIIIPGSVLLIYLIYENNQFLYILTVSYSVIFFIISFILGHLIQALANIVLNNKIVDYPNRRTKKTLKRKKMSTLNYREIISNLDTYNQNRISIFNHQFSFLRGLSFAFIVIFLLSCFIYVNYILSITSFLFILLSMYRMNRYSNYYITTLLLNKKNNLFTSSKLKH